MQSPNPNSRIPGTVTHPDTAEWMAFLYQEASPERQRELGAHLAACPACAAQVKAWNATRQTLDEWTLPAREPARQPKLVHRLFPSAAPAAGYPVLSFLKWAAAAAVVLVLGFGLGRRTAPSSAGARELSELRASVVQLADAVQRQQAAYASNTIALASAAAGTETLRLLAEYSRAQEDQRGADQQTIKTAMDSLNARVERLRTELETVALNTEDGFQQTHRNLAQLVSYSPTPAH